MTLLFPPMMQLKKCYQISHFKSYQTTLNIFNIFKYLPSRWLKCYFKKKRKISNCKALKTDGNPLKITPFCSFSLSRCIKIPKGQQTKICCFYKFIFCCYLYHNWAFFNLVWKKLWKLF